MKKSSNKNQTVQTKFIAVLIILIHMTFVLDCQGQKVEFAQSAPDHLDTYYDIIKDNNSNYYVVGMNDGDTMDMDFDTTKTYNMLPDRYDIYVAKYDVNDRLKWVYVLGCNSHLSRIIDIDLDTSGNVMLFVTANNEIIINSDTTFKVPKKTCLVVEISSDSGKVNSFHTLASSYDNEIKSASVDQENNIYLLLNITQELDVTFNDTQTLMKFNGLYTAKYSEDFELLWIVQELLDRSREVHLWTDHDGNTYYSAILDKGTKIEFRSPFSKTKVLTKPNSSRRSIFKRKKNGDFQFAVFISQTNGTMYIDPEFDSRNILNVCGWSIDPISYYFSNKTFYFKPVGSYDGFVFQLDTSGNLVQFAQNYSTSWDVIYSIAHDENDNVYVSGRHLGDLDIDFSQKKKILKTNALTGYIAKYSPTLVLLDGMSIYNTRAIAQIVPLNVKQFLIRGNGRGQIVNFQRSGKPFYMNPFTTLPFRFLAKYQSPNDTQIIISDTACDIYYLNDSAYTKSGIYYDTVISNFSKKFYKLNLVINEMSTYSLDTTVCSQLILNSDTFIKDGIYFQYFRNQLKCDSLLEINLKIKAQNDTSISLQSCDSFNLSNQTVYESGVFRDTLVNVKGCDSIIKYNLTILKSDTQFVSDTGCKFYLRDKIVFKSSGIHQYMLTKSNGCDSVIILDLKLYGLDTTDHYISDCENLLIQDSNISKSGEYFFRLQNSIGCDSMIMVHFTKLKPDTFNINVTGCKIACFRDSCYNKSGIFYYQPEGLHRCDSIFRLNVKVQNFDKIIYRNGDTLFTNNIAGSYSWHYCSLIPDDQLSNKKFYIVRKTGNYLVVSGNSDCTDTSNCFEVLNLNTNEIGSNQFQLIPNPVINSFKLVPSNNEQLRKVELYDLKGNLMLFWEDENFTKRIDYNISPIPEGSYLIKVYTADTINHIRIIKLTH